MKSYILIILLLFITSLAFADEVFIPFSCYPKGLQGVFADRGKKLDLSGNDRTEDSWGFIESKGSGFYLYSYKSISKEEFQVLTDIIFSNLK